MKIVSRRSAESRGFSPGAPVSSHRESWQGGLGLAPLTDPSTVAVLRDQTWVIRWLPEAPLESLRLDQLELRPLQFNLALSCQSAWLTHTPSLTYLHIIATATIKWKSNFRRLLYLSLVRSHLSFGCEIWAPQGPSADLLRLEGIQRRATKFILKDYESSYPDRLKKLNLIPLSYWHEIKDIIFFYKCKSGLYELDTNQFINQPLHHSTRSSSGDFLRPNLCKTSLFRDSYFNRIVFLWNNKVYKSVLFSCYP